jgi:hypothetical protein
VGFHWYEKGFRDQVEDTVKALEATLSRKMGVHLGHKKNVHRIFATLLTDSIQHMLKLHRMMDGQFLRYWTVLGTACDDGNWILIIQFAETVFVGTCTARLIGADAFSEFGHIMCAMYLCAAIQTHRVLQVCIDLDLIAQPEG